MKNIFKLNLILFALAITVSCSTDDKVVDDVSNGVSSGAVLRALNDTEENDPLVQGSGGSWTVQLEEQDAEEGALLQQMNVYVQFQDQTVLSAGSISGEGDDLTFPATTPDDLDFEDVLLKTLNAEDFSTDTPFGLPRVDLVITEAELSTVLNTADWNSEDIIQVRLELVLTDGRVFSTDNAGGIITGFGSFFSSPFQHRIIIDSGIGINYLEEDNNFYTPGFTNNYYVLGEITDQDMGNNIQTVNVYKRFQDNTVEDLDISRKEELVASYTGTDFGTSPDGFPTMNVAFDEDEILDFAPLVVEIDGVMEEFLLLEEDLGVGDAFFIRYEVITNDGRVITNEIAESNFYDVVAVTDCPFPPLDETASFTGDYLAEQITPSIFGYDTWDSDGGGVVLRLFSEVLGGTQFSAGTAIEANQRSFDADYLAPLGGLNFRSYIIQFDLCTVNIVDGAGPIGDFTGWACGGVSIITGPLEVPGGSYNAEDDAEFTLKFFDDFTNACDGTTAEPEVKFTKQ